MKLTLVAATLLLSLPPVGAAGQVAADPTPVEPGATPAERLEGTGIWPLAGEVEVVRAFEPPDVRWARGHRGVDLAAAPARAVLASLSGRISFAGSVAGRPVVVVQHAGTRTTYEPVLADVAVGDRVEQGSRLGWLQAGGSHCMPAACLHWGWRDGETYLDPLDLVGATGVRLLPLWQAAPHPLGLAPIPVPARRSAPPAPPPHLAPADRRPWWPLMPWDGPVGRPS